MAPRSADSEATTRVAADTSEEESRADEGVFRNAPSPSRLRRASGLRIKDSVALRKACRRATLRAAPPVPSGTPVKAEDSRPSMAGLEETACKGQTPPAAEAEDGAGWGWMPKEVGERCRRKGPELAPEQLPLGIAPGAGSEPAALETGGNADASLKPASPAKSGA